jgi:hypothetical protein
VRIRSWHIRFSPCICVLAGSDTYMGLLRYSLESIVYCTAHCFTTMMSRQREDQRISSPTLCSLPKSTLPFYIVGGVDNVPAIILTYLCHILTGRRTCAVGNGGCHHICRDSRKGPICSCHPKYYLSPADDSTCLRE